MYSVVKKFLEKLGNSETDVIEFTRDDTRVAVAALYYHVIVVDGHIRHQEMDRYREILSETLGVSEDELESFEKEVLKQVKNESSLFPFTVIVKRLPIEQRREILAHMHQISLSDSELHEFEINLVERAAELIGLVDEVSAFAKDDEDK